MSFNISTVDGILVHRSDGSDFNEEALTLNGAGNITISQTAGTATFTVSGTVSNTSISVEDDNAEVVADTASIDFGHALTVTSGAGNEAEVAVDESEFLTVVFLTGNQTISGIKTFADDVVFEGNINVSGTIISTEELLVEDNAIFLNSTVTGVPSLDAYFAVERGSSTDAALLWNETLEQWEAGLSGSTERILLESDLTDINADIATVSGNVVALSGYVGSNFLRLDGSNDPLTGNLDLASGINILLAVSGTSDVGSAASPLAELYVDQGFNYFAPTDPFHIVNKAYVDAQTATLTVQDDDSTVVGSASTLDFGHAIDVTDGGGGEAEIAVDESEFTTVVFLSGNQTISGTKTFASPIVTASGLTPASGTAEGAEGTIRWSDDYLFVAVGTDTWKRVPLATF